MNGQYFQKMTIKTCVWTKILFLHKSLHIFTMDSNHILSSIPISMSLHFLKKLFSFCTKVHSFWKSCLHDLYLTQKSGTYFHFQFYESTTFLCQSKIVQNFFKRMECKNSLLKSRKNLTKTLDVSSEKLFKPFVLS